MDPDDSLKSPYIELNNLYQQLLKAWNDRSLDDFASKFEDGYLIGFDGSQVEGSTNITSHLRPIFTIILQLNILVKGKVQRSFVPRSRYFTRSLE
jgi:uncharacterized protein (TIGR02246 family)